MSAGSQKAETCSQFNLVLFEYQLVGLCVVLYIIGKTAAGPGRILDLGASLLLLFSFISIMEEELAELRRLVTQLQADNQRMRQEQDADQSGPRTAPGSSAPGNPSSQAPVTERLIFLPRDRKCPMFRGKTGLNITEWADEVQACMRGRPLSSAEQALFMYDHLEGEAREEIKYRSQREREEPATILAILQELYGCSRSYVSLQEDFFSRKQQEGETLQEFSHALMCLIDRVVRKAPSGLLNKDVLLRDQFVEYVSDCSLRRELKQFVRAHPAATLIEVRSEAIRWEQEGMPGGGRGRSYSVPSAFGFQHTVQGGHHSYSKAGNPPPTSELGELKEILRNQQEQLNQLTMSVAALNRAPRSTTNYRSNTGNCWKCQQPGHLARECNGAYVPPKNRSASQGPQHQHSPLAAPIRASNGPSLNQGDLRQPATVVAHFSASEGPSSANQGNAYPLNF